ncbi:hypothetical protein D3C85_825750 [compost metagenome]
MLGNHYRYIIHACRSFGQPAIGIVHGQLRFYPFRRPLRCNQVPELVQVPEGIPESIAAQSQRIRVFKFLYFLKGIYPAAIQITPGIPAGQCPVHIGIKTYFLSPVVRLNSHAANQLVPGITLFVSYFIKTPSIGFGNFLFQVIRSIFNAHHRNTRTHLHHLVCSGIELYISACIFHFPGIYQVFITQAIVLPGSEFLDGLIEFNYEMKLVILVYIARPGTGRKLSRYPFYPPVAYLFQAYIF